MSTASVEEQRQCALEPEPVRNREKPRVWGTSAIIFEALGAIRVTTRAHYTGRHPLQSPGNRREGVPGHQVPHRPVTDDN